MGMEDVVRDFRTAIGQNCLGWFCERYGLGAMEYEAETSIDLIRLVAQWLRDQELLGRE